MGISGNLTVQFLDTLGSWQCACSKVNYITNPVYWIADLGPYSWQVGGNN